MYLAKSLNSEQVQAPLYADIFSRILENAIEKSDKDNIDKAINEAKEIALEEKDIYSIDHKHYFLITTLLRNYYEGLKRLQQDPINNDVYSDILEIIK